LEAGGFAVRPVATRDFGNEILTVYAVRPRTTASPSAQRDEELRNQAGEDV